MNLQIENQLALVSASTKGIGLAIARALAREAPASSSTVAVRLSR
nr:hypothetical protein [Verrucomicrobium spinosum]